MYEIFSKTSQRKIIINTLDDKKPFHVFLNPSVLLTILFLVFHSHERLITLAGHKWYKNIYTHVVFHPRMAYQFKFFQMMYENFDRFRIR